ncbi:3'-5' exonuclease eri1 [Psilocybe cubensis]|uniref:3'-5' exonuclease eri1 n=1 Tax=Psilocybe cubensis TaxID=181762 RepID=A0ACB8H9B7_PSICU|nr:3'-5' exonuclease eri1 [Psilocybe cubensis]KAH9483755.1 3'-5' exonuclease eri1 [Psilocybe cubensis]
MLVMIATCLLRSFYKRVIASRDKAQSTSSQTSSIQANPIFSEKPQPPAAQPTSPPTPSSSKKNMRYLKNTRRVKGKKQFVQPTTPIVHQKTKQPYEVFLILDIEGTCKPGTDFNYPNEIIELPVSVLQWTDRSEDGRADTLEVIDEFRSFVRPTWRPTLSAFCTELTGITQEQVDVAPCFSEVLVQLEAFLVKNGLLEEGTGRRLKRYCWCSDGPWDIRDFFVKQCFISQVQMPAWIQGDILDVRSTVLHWMYSEPTAASKIHGSKRPSLNISAQLKVLGLPDFEGRQHSGIDDTRNIAKIVTELARRGVRLFPNTAIDPRRRWQWMGKHGQVLEEGLP